MQNLNTGFLFKGGGRSALVRTLCVIKVAMHSPIVTGNHLCRYCLVLLTYQKQKQHLQNKQQSSDYTPFKLNIFDATDGSKRLNDCQPARQVIKYTCIDHFVLPNICTQQYRGTVLK